MARFKIFWTVAALSVIGFVTTSLLANSDSSIFQNNPMTSEWSENIKARFMDAYNATIKEYGTDKVDVLDPCKLRESFDNNGISKCGNFNETED